MQSLSDHDIDKLFKDAADGHRPPFDPKDWDAMSQKLDARPANLPNSSKSNQSLTLTIVVLVSLVIGWYSSEYFSASDLNTDSMSTDIISMIADGEATDESMASGRREKVTGPLPITSSNEKVFESSSAVSKTSKTLQPFQNDTASKKATSLKVNETVVGNVGVQGVTTTSEHRSIVLQQDLGISSSAYTWRDHGALVEMDSRNEPNNARKIYKRNNIKADNVESDSSKNENASIRDQSIASTEQEAKKENENKQSAFYRLSVRALVSPDYSSDRFKQKDKTGLNYGIEAGYAFNRNLSAHVGLISSRKYYTADHIQYDVYETNFVKGDCRMWDLPINIRYQFFPGKQYAVFVSMGLSSYIMDEEQYDFEVQTGYGKQAYNMEVKNGNREWFKMMNLSVGLQKKVSDRFTLQVEPFVKIPLAGVGAGKIRLASFGSFVAVQYNLFRAKQP